MNKITPPLKKGERRQPVTTIAVYQSTVKILETLVERADTTRIEYLRWLAECAQAGLVGPIPDDDFLAAVVTTVDAVALGAITPQEATDAFGGIMRRVAQAARLEALDNWTEEHCP